jgi:hypothetical protein
MSSTSPPDIALHGHINTWCQGDSDKRTHCYYPEHVKYGEKRDEARLRCNLPQAYFGEFSDILLRNEMKREVRKYGTVGPVLPAPL